MSCLSLRYTLAFFINLCLNKQKRHFPQPLISRVEAKKVLLCSEFVNSINSSTLAIRWRNKSRCISTQQSRPRDAQSLREKWPLPKLIAFLVDDENSIPLYVYAVLWFQSTGQSTQQRAPWDAIH